MSCISSSIYTPCSSWSEIAWALKSIMWASTWFCPSLQASLIFLKISSLWSRRDMEPFSFMFSAWVVNHSIYTKTELIWINERLLFQRLVSPTLIPTCLSQAVYMFHALAIVCDVYFVPSLEKISEVRSANTSWLVMLGSLTLCSMPSFNICFFDLILQFVSDQNKLLIWLEWWKQMIVMLKHY